MSFIRSVFAVAIGVLIVLLVIFGIDTFYPAPPDPKYPEPPRSLALDSPEWAQAWDEYQKERARITEIYLQEMEIYHTGLFLVALPLGALLAVGGTFVRRRREIAGASLILGGTGTMIYAITPYPLDSLWRFVGIAVILAVLILVGFRVFKSGDRVEEPQAVIASPDEIGTRPSHGL